VLASDSKKMSAELSKITFLNDDHESQNPELGRTGERGFFHNKLSGTLPDSAQPHFGAQP